MNKTYFVVELFDPEDGAGLAYWQDHGVWVREPVKAQLFPLEHLARATHSVLTHNMLYVRVMYFDPNAAEGEGLRALEEAA